MLKRIMLTNYKSFKTLDFSLKSYKDTQDLVLLYGENGSGKSNLVSSLVFLINITTSFRTLKEVEPLIKTKQPNELTIEHLLKLMQATTADFNLKDRKRLNSNEETMELSYTFLINNKQFDYTVTFDHEKLISETLRAPLVKNQVTVFNIEYRDELTFDFNEQLFSKQYRYEVIENLEKYFGKFTLLALIDSERRSKNAEYIAANIHQDLLLFINYIRDIDVFYSEKTPYQRSKFLKGNILSNLLSGRIKQSEQKRIDKTRELLKLYFQSLYSDIKDIKYVTTFDDQDLTYELYVDKIIGGTLASVPFRLESKGTKKLLDLFPYFLKLIAGGIVVIDELEAGIHEVLLTLLIERVQLFPFTGQLIVTTHNLMLLDIAHKNNIYILDVDDLGNKKVYSLRDSGVRIQPNHSVYNNYKKGAYGGVPSAGYFDFSDLYDTLNEVGDDE